MKEDIQRYITNCITCQQIKADHRHPPGLLCPLPVPARPWEDLSLDFISGLPPYRGNSVILVIVDHFSKGIHLGPLPSHLIAFSVAQLFMELSGKLHGMPRILVSDRDLLFLSRFWQELFKMSGTKLGMSSAYHPQSDGQTEAMNRIVEQYLRAFVHQNPATWGRFLVWAEWSYNTSVHSATGKTPYEVTYDKQPPSLPQYITGSSNIQVVDEWLTNRETLNASLIKKLTKAQQKMKEIADKQRRDVSYEEWDVVLVKLRPRRQTSVTGETYSKLAKRYYGPFQIVKKIGSVAYQLNLPSSSRIHPVFHCSLLKPFNSSTIEGPLDLPATAEDNEPLINPPWFSTLSEKHTNWKTTACSRSVGWATTWRYFMGKMGNS